MHITITNGTLTQISETLTAATGYNLPSDITVSGATKAYDSTTGVVTLTSPTSTMSVTASGDIITYPITTSLTNLTASGATSISYGGTATVTLSAASGMKLPVSITATGATSEYDFLTGTITLSEPTGAVTITASALTQEEYFNSVANGLVDTINEKANTSGQKGLDEAWVTAQGINAIPTITLTLSQVISQDPLTVQLTNEQYDIVSATEDFQAFKVDATALGMSVATVTKTYENGTYCFVPDIIDDVVTAWEFTLDDTNMTLTRTVHEGGGTQLNIAYGTTAPSDTSKLWIEGDEPTNIFITTDMVVGAESFQASIASLTAGCCNAAAVGTKIYLFGGDGNTDSKTIQVFDTTNNTTTTLETTLSRFSRSINAVAVGTKIYLFGGDASGVAYSAIQVFDTSDDTISTLTATLPVASSRIGAAAVGTKIYLFGGKTTNSQITTIRVFDTVNNTINTLTTTLPVAAYGIATAAVGTKIYLFGGMSAYNAGLNTIQVFDTTDNTINTLTTTLPSAYGRAGAAAFGTKVYLFGGYTGSATLNKILSFDTTDNTITPLPDASASLGADVNAVLIGTKIYLFKSLAINSFTIFAACADGDIIVQLDALTNLFNLINSDEIVVKAGVTAVYRGNSSNVAELENAYLYQNNDWTQISGA